MPAVVVTKELRRSYNGYEAVRGVSLEVEQGEIFGLLGPNGAGKTTTLSMISTRIRPTQGDAWVYGKHVVRDVHAVRRLLNVAPQEEALYPTLTAQENLEFFARLYGIPAKERPRLIAQALEAIELAARKDERVDTYSGGMRRRLNLGCALVSGPRIVLLDEPTVGVDPQSRAHIFDAVRKLRSQGVTILYTTHYLEEAEELCDRIAIMDEGRVIALGTLPELLARSKSAQVIEMRFAAPPRSTRALQNLDGVQRVEQIGNEVRLFTSNAQGALPQLCQDGTLLDQPIVQLRVTPVTLESIFIELTGKALRD
ncbi:MAG TPA: ABC transporter ATP-binding protein [Candidatus Bathyarchaeia archaeon]|nr:ABC transporter ATP-binding protein [Candidatus Bathyarchaeia archaeon]